MDGDHGTQTPPPICIDAIGRWLAEGDRQPARARAGSDLPDTDENCFHMDTGLGNWTSADDFLREAGRLDNDNEWIQAVGWGECNEPQQQRPPWLATVAVSVVAMNGAHVGGRGMFGVCRMLGFTLSTPTYDE